LGLREMGFCQKSRSHGRGLVLGHDHLRRQVKQVLEDKEALAARRHRSPDLLDALLMTFTFSDQG
jgi:hypothetical protein